MDNAYHSTYRLQFNQSLNFKQANRLVDYLARLGVAAVYASPILGARPGSVHGYDVTNHAILNSDLGSLDDFQAFSHQLQKNKMGFIMDVVPNHMCIADPSNTWWMDVLENGPSSLYARYFDIEWHPHKTFLSNKVLLPFLGDQYGKILENQEIQVEYEKGSFFARYYALKLPVAPRTSVLILEDVLDILRDQSASPKLISSLRTIASALNNLPLRTETSKEKIQERHRKKEILKKQLSLLVANHTKLQKAVSEILTVFNGKRGVPDSFNKLERLLEEQAYRLSYWKVAADEINYRRFFDINELAAIRIEEPYVFNAVHALVKEFVMDRHITGLRIDHIDGLLDPKQYLINLQDSLRLWNGSRSSAPFYVVVEKILESSESLRKDWPVAGTTGYDFLNLLNGLYVQPTNKSSFLKLYKRYTGQKGPFFDIMCKCKEMITHVSNASELYVLASKLERISEQHRWSRDFTFEGLRYALREIISCFPVYRSYMQMEDKSIHQEDRNLIQSALVAAKKRNPTTNVTIFDFIGQVLLREDPDGLTVSQIQERREFAMRFQQLTGPIMAKGLEDTAFYRYYPLASLNEVGGNPERFGVSIREFHRKNKERQKNWPLTMLATTTHDTKRSEDVRARLNVLSEIPAPWYRTLRRWTSWNKDKKTNVDGRGVPHFNEEYLLYQTLIGTWPIQPFTQRSLHVYIKRIQQYMLKALREAKVHTSWVNQNDEYEQAMMKFIEKIFKPHPKNRFLFDIKKSIRTIIKAGRLNSLSQVFLKLTCPGIPDFYQGTELLNLTLVDPDNRGQVPFGMLKSTLKETENLTPRQTKAWIRRLMRKPVKGRIKLFVTRRLLRFRQKNPDLFLRGDYSPLVVKGQRKNHIIAFARRYHGKTCLSVAGRFFLNIDDGDGRSFQSASLKDTLVVIPGDMAKGHFRNVLTGDVHTPQKKGRSYVLPVNQLFVDLPIALIEKI